MGHKNSKSHVAQTKTVTKKRNYQTVFEVYKSIREVGDIYANEKNRTLQIFVSKEAHQDWRLYLKIQKPDCQTCFDQMQVI